MRLPSFFIPMRAQSWFYGGLEKLLGRFERHAFIFRRLDQELQQSTNRFIIVDNKYTVFPFDNILFLPSWGLYNIKLTNINCNLVKEAKAVA